MTDDKSQHQLDALSAVRRNARAAEKRLNATEAEMRFAADIASGIYTVDMIPTVMDADKIKELADCYIMEQAFVGDSVQQIEIKIDPPQEDLSATLPDSSPSNPYIPSEQKIQNMADQIRTSAISGTDTKTPANTSAPSVKYKKGSSSKRPHRLWKLLLWLPAICFLVFAVVVCIHEVDSPEPKSHAVNYTTNLVGSVNSSFIHRTTCRHAEKILEKNRVYYKTVEDAAADGRSKCSECLGVSSGDTKTTTSSNGGLVPITPPVNGCILYEDGSDRIAPLTIKTDGSGYYLIRLRDHYSNAVVMTFFVHGGKEVECDVPLGEFDLSYSFGENWYGRYSKFGDNAYCAKADEIFEFYEEDDEVVGWTVTLYKVAGGDLGFDEIPSDQF